MSEEEKAAIIVAAKLLQRWPVGLRVRIRDAGFTEEVGVILAQRTYVKTIGSPTISGDNLHVIQVSPRRWWECPFDALEPVFD